VSLNVESLVNAGDDGVLDSFVFAGVPVQHVWRAGRQVVADGAHHARAAVQVRYRAALARLLA